MKHLFIINPAAGSWDHTQQYREQIRPICEARGLDYRIEVSSGPGQCREIARKAAQTGEEYRIYSCGGDGTLNEIVSGVAGYPNVAVTMFAGGSGNDFIRIFSDTEPFHQLERLLDCEEASFDLMKCNDSYCLNICSVGLDARIGTDVARYKRIPMLSGFRAYAVSAIVNTIRGINGHYRVELNGEIIDRELALICICNGRYYGGGFNPVPDADPSDGSLEVLVARDISRWKVLRMIGAYKNGQYAKVPQLIRRYSTDRVVIHCDGPSSVNLDGELLTAKDVDVRVSGEKLRFFYPKGLRWKP